MKISGLQKMTLLDYPGKVACTVFTQGCNFRCPFCHNSDLLGAEGPYRVEEETLMAFLKKRVGLLDAVCITGGEPTLQAELPQLLEKIKELGYLVKLDTNGTRPQVVKELVTRGLVDYVAMDIKNSPARYGETAGVSRLELEAIEETMGFLMAGNVDFEFRTTVVAELHRAQDMKEIGQWLQKLSPDKKPAKLFLQAYADRDSVLMGGLSAHSKETMQEFKDILAPYADIVELRGIS
jgi:pyruvate formate lyase activating enzyme